MSYNQSRSDKNESTQYRKTGRSSNSSNLHRSPTSGSYNKGGGATGPAPSSSISSSRSLKKPNNAQGGVYKSNVVSTLVPNPTQIASSELRNNLPAAGNIQNGTSHSASSQSPLIGSSDASTIGRPSRQHENQAFRASNTTVLTAPTSLPPAVNTDATTVSTPAKVAGDSSKASFPFQFGSLSPGFMNGMQIPARTSSAPPNLDEQKRDQQPQKKDGVSGDKVIPGEIHPVSKVKKDVQIPNQLPITQTQKPPIIPFAVASIQVPFHQPQTAVPLGSSPQIQTQGVAATSLQMQMPVGLPLGNAPQVQQPLFMQAHAIQPQGMMHQGQSMNFPGQLGHQLPHQLSNMGMGITAHYPQQQSGKYGAQRKTMVKITDPKTNEELRLADGGTTGMRSHSSVPQSQPNPSYAHLNYYPTSYEGGNIYFPAHGSMPLPSWQIAPTSQASRYNYTKTQSMPGIDPSNPVNISGSVIHGASAEILSVDNSRDVRNPQSSAQISSVPVIVRPPTAASSEKSTKPVSSSTHSVNKSGGAIHGASEHLISENSRDVRSSLSSGSSSKVQVIVRPPTGTSSEKVANPTPAYTASKESATHSSSKQIPVDSASPESDSCLELSAEESVQTASPVEANNKEIMSTYCSPEYSKTDKNAVPFLQDACLTTSMSKESVGLVDERIMETSQSHVSSSEDRPCKAEPAVVSGQTGYEDEKSVVDPKSPVVTETADLVADEASSNASIEDHAHDRSYIPDNLNPDGEVSTSSEARSGGAYDVDRSLSDEMANVSTSKKCESLEEDKVMNAKRSGHGQARHADSQRNNGDNSRPASASSDIDTADDVAGNSSSLSGTKDKATSELSRSKATPARLKKKWKEILQKADAAGTTADLYLAYKGPEEKKEISASLEVSDVVEKQAQPESQDDNSSSDAKVTEHKIEPEDWEDALDMSTPKLNHLDDDGHPSFCKKYSRDFLLKFSDRFTDLPDGFKVTADIAEALNYNAPDRDMHTSPGRVMDRSNSSSRMDRRGVNVAEDERWNRVPGQGGNAGFPGNANFRPGQGGNFGVLRGPRAQGSQQYVTGILSGPMQSMAAQGQGGQQRNSLDSERWQRSASFQQKGLIPSPNAPLQVMHKAEKKYEVGKSSSDEEAKQRQLKAILNKLTPQNFEKLFEQVKAVNIDNAWTLKGVISQIFDKALMEPTFCEMYANFCFHLARELPNFVEDNEKVTFKRLLLTKCQEEFERGEKEQEEANKVDEDGEIKQSAEEREEKRLKARRRMLGNIRLIGELYKKRMLTERIMHECIKKLLGGGENPEEEDVEALCKLMSTIGEMIDHPKAKEHMDMYFKRMSTLSENPNLSSRIRFMLKDAIDLRRNNWQQRRKIEGPKKIDDVHRDAAQERSLQSGRLSRAPTVTQSRRGTTDFGPRGASTVSSTTSMTGLRGMPAPGRGGSGPQDVRYEERQPYDARALGPLPHRSAGDDLITLGPQGNLARVMSVAGPSSTAASPASDFVDSRRTNSGFNGYSNVSDRPSSLNVREERHVDRTNLSPPSRTQAPPDKALPEEILREKSLSAIKEYYSARDEKEVALCIKELKSPSFHPSMISLWVTDSFERKDAERELLAKLLVNMAASHDGVLTPPQLLMGFECVLATIEDAVNDAPRAAEYLGRVLAMAVVEDVVPLEALGRLLRDGGEEPGRLVEVGVAGDIVGSILEIVRVEKGEVGMNDVKSRSGLIVEDFLPASPYRSKVLERFVRMQ